MEKHTSNIFAKTFKTLFKRFHLMIFFIFIVAGLSVAVIMINDILSGKIDDGYKSPIKAGTIDQTTLNRLETLHTSTAGTPTPELPNGRINPLAE